MRYFPFALAIASCSGSQPSAGTDATTGDASTDETTAETSADADRGEAPPPPDAGFTDFATKPDDTPTRKHCDVVIAGGSTAALAAAFAAAREGAKTCLLEPTDWIGGQLTASAVSAIDFAWHKFPTLDVAAIDRDPANVTPEFAAMLAAIGNPGRCWVSPMCFEPKTLLATLVAKEKALPNLVVLRDTVVKSVTLSTDGTRVRSVRAVARVAKPGIDEWSVRPSSDLPDWYAEAPSARFDKTVVELSLDDGASGRDAAFVDATEWGELLPLASAPYLLGVEATEGSEAGDDRCGQSIVFPFVERIETKPTAEPKLGADAPHPELYALGKFTWQQVWTYRRVRSTGTNAAALDLSLQNWGTGNDYPFGYLFLSHDAAKSQVADWVGGIDLALMAAAEKNALGYHDWFKTQDPTWAGRVTLAKDVLGTTHGLAKLPYIRDTRRSVGLDGFVWTSDAITGDPATQKTAAIPTDRIAIGAYDVDIHSLRGCSYPSYVTAPHQVLPFFVPFRALTNGKLANLLVAGKTMAQSFVVNAATRLQPIEWSSGTAAGVAAAMMAKTNRNSRALLEQVDALQSRVRVYTPVSWTVGGKTIP